NATGKHVCIITNLFRSAHFSFATFAPLPIYHIRFMTFLVIIIALALVFDYINGFHDAAISIATIVSTKVLTPFQAVLWAAIFNFAAFFIFKYFIGEFKIGNTIAHFVNRDFITLPVIFSGLIA